MSRTHGLVGEQPYPQWEKLGVLHEQSNQQSTYTFTVNDTYDVVRVIINQYKTNSADGFTGLTLNGLTSEYTTTLVGGTSSTSDPEIQLESGIDHYHDIRMMARQHGEKLAVSLRPTGVGNLALYGGHKDGGRINKFTFRESSSFPIAASVYGWRHEGLD